MLKNKCIYIIFFSLISFHLKAQIISFKNELGSPVSVSKIIISSGLKKDIDRLSEENENLRTMYGSKND